MSTFTERISELRRMVGGPERLVGTVTVDQLTGLRPLPA